MTPIDLCNNALAEIGHDRPVADLNGTTKESARCALFLPRARLDVLGSHPWSFSTRPQAATPVTLPAALRMPAFPHAYARPPDALRLTATDAEGLPVSYRIDAHALHAEAPVTQLSPTCDDPDPDQWPAHVQEAVIAALALRLANPITGSAKVVQQAAQSYASKLRLAKSLDAQDSLSHPGTPRRYAAARL